MARNRGNGIDWMGLPMIATVARLLCRELTLENEYLRLENRLLKEKAEATFSPHGLWMRQMGRNLLMACHDLGVSPRVAGRQSSVWSPQSTALGAEHRHGLVLIH